MKKLRRMSNRTSMQIKSTEMVTDHRNFQDLQTNREMLLTSNKIGTCWCYLVNERLSYHSVREQRGFFLSHGASFVSAVPSSLCRADYLLSLVCTAAPASSPAVSFCCCILLVTFWLQQPPNYNPALSSVLQKLNQLDQWENVLWNPNLMKFCEIPQIVLMTW